MSTVEYDSDGARQRLEIMGVSVSLGNADHEHWRAGRSDASATAYGGKAVVQGPWPADLLVLIRPKDGRIYVYFGGTSRGSPGSTAIGWTTVTSDGIVAKDPKRIGETTNNRAEYEALVEVLSVTEKYSRNEVDVRDDSQLVIKQVRGEWNMNNPGLKEHCVKARELLSAFGHWSLECIPREINDHVNSLANEALSDA